MWKSKIGGNDRVYNRFVLSMIGVSPWRVFTKNPSQSDYLTNQEERAQAVLRRLFVGTSNSCVWDLE